MKVFPLIISNRLLKVLSLIDHKIARDLISLNCGTDNLYPQTFIDINLDDSSSISFIQSNKASEILEIDESNYNNGSLLLYLSNLSEKHIIYKNNRSNTRIGRFINSNFPKKYKISNSTDKDDIETFSNMFKSVMDREHILKLMDVVNGDKISHFYSYRNYYNNNGTLGNSCMSSVDNSYFDIYTKNPDKCSLVVMYSDLNKQKIKGRALLWNLTLPEGRCFMDRIYTNDYADEQKFIDFAKMNNWLYKSSQSYGYELSICDPSINKNQQMDLMTNLTKISHRRYPYLDTMGFYNYNSGVLSNTIKFGALLQISSTDGSSYTITTLYSKYYGHSISKNDAVYCIYGDDYVYSKDAVKVYNSGLSDKKVFSVPGYDGVAEMRIKDADGKEIIKHFPKEKCTYSEHLSTWIFTDSSILVWSDSHKTTQVLEHVKRLNYSYTEINGEYYLKSLISKTTGTFKRNYTKK